MTDDTDDDVEEAMEQIKEVLQKAKQTVTLHAKVEEVLKGVPFDIRMSVLNMVTIKTIMEESDSEIEAAAWVARCTSNYMLIIEQNSDALNKEDDEPTGTMQ